MSTSGPRYHIPFPRDFLSLNTPSHKRTVSETSTVVSPSEAAPHSFLSNRPVARHASISSVSSDGSMNSPPSSPPPPNAQDPRVIEQGGFSFLKLNSKFSAAPKTTTELKGAGEQTSFLSNKH